jgi:hypothetical protein
LHATASELRGFRDFKEILGCGTCLENPANRTDYRPANVDHRMDAFFTLSSKE